MLAIQVNIVTACMGYLKCWPMLASASVTLGLHFLVSSRQNHLLPRGVNSLPLFTNPTLLACCTCHALRAKQHRFLS